MPTPESDTSWFASSYRIVAPVRWGSVGRNPRDDSPMREPWPMTFGWPNRKTCVTQVSRTPGVAGRTSVRELQELAGCSTLPLRLSRQEALSLTHEFAIEAFFTTRIFPEASLGIASTCWIRTAIWGPR